jgi:hypothetical protein
LNPKLIRYLHEHSVEQLLQRTPLPPRRRVWRVCDRPTEQDIVRLIIAFRIGAPKQVLAERYGIGMKSVKKVLRQYGARKRSRYDVEC